MTKALTLEKKILDKIRKENLRPTARGFFRARDIAFWILLGIFVAALGVGIGMVIFTIRGTDLGLFEKLGLSLPEKIAYSIPSFWILASFGAAAIAFINLRRTRKGYRVGAKQFIVVASAVGIVAGSFVYASNLSKYVDDVASNIPLYTAIVPLNTNHWFDPEHGLLSGVVRSKDSDTDFKLRDENQELWRVVGKSVVSPPTFKFSAGDRVKIIGVKIGDGLFELKEIRPNE